MSTNIHSNIHGFLYRADDISPVAVQLAAKTQSRAIFDLSGRDLLEIAPLIKAANVRDARITLDQFLSPEFDRFLDQVELDTLWVECFLHAGSGTAADFLDAVARHRPRVRIVPVTGDWNLLSALRDASDPIDMVALKGAEAMGLTGSDSVHVMFGTVSEWRKDPDAKPDIIIWGGVGSPEAAAAFMACGARGIVFESLHWLTDQIMADAGAKDRLAKLRFEHTRSVGTADGLACRVFDKGNSRAVRSLMGHMAGSGDDADEAARTLIEYVNRHQVPALKSAFGPDELVLLGPEAFMASAFVDRFGSSTASALQGFLDEIDSKLKTAFLARDRFVGSPAARELGSEYPFIQGAMSWISEVPEFALKVHQAGGLPTVALGMRSRDELDGLLSSLSAAMIDRAWAVNLIALPENPNLKDQLDLLAQYRPPFVVVAAGEPAHAARLLEQGHRVIYITADPELMRLAFQTGVRFVVLEGEEAGGHVGSHTTLTLAQAALEMKRREPELFAHKFLFLAGGIFNRRTAFWAAMLGADGVQMGTVYLSSEEIVSTGALSAIYQKQVMAAAPGATAVTGRSIGLGVRSLKTDKLAAIRSAERQFIQTGGDESEYRRTLETLAAGSLYIAARSRKGPIGETLSEAECLREGQFMSGAVAGAIRRTTTLTALHKELARGALPGFSDMSSKPAASRTAEGAVRPERVAITGMAQVNSLGDSPAEVWKAVLACKSGITEVPPELWDHSRYYDPHPGRAEKSYCRVGAFKRVDISRRDIGVAPQDFRTMSASTRMTLWLARQAIAESGLDNGNVARERVGVFISQNSGEYASTLNDLIIGFAADKIVGSLRDVLALTPELERRAIDRIKAGRVAIDDTTLVGRLNSAAGGFICNQYGFRGPSFAVTAACASSLVALYSAIHLILNGDIDAAVIGGGEEILTPEHFVEFASVGSLAGISGVKREAHAYSRPFDAGRDGMVLGEGGGVIVIERELSARRRGARIHALIAGVGASNSDRGMVESLAESQIIALRNAFNRAGVSPETVSLVECHATSTAQGDMEEVKALKTVFPKGSRVALAAFKSQIGHTLGASGVNGLVRGVMALKSGVLPPTINYEKPDPKLGLGEHGFYVPKQPEPWPAPGDGLRRMLASAFGFGGANYTVVLEEERADRAAVMISPLSAEWEHGPDAFGIEGVFSTTSDISGQAWRVGVVADDAGQAAVKAGQAANLSEPPSAKQLRQLAKEGVFIAPSGLRSKPAVVFTGQGSAYTGMGRALYDAFPLIREWMDRLSSLADYDLLDLMFHGQAEQLKQTLFQQPALFCLEYAIYRQLADLGLKPSAMAGHSLGEIVALTAAGSFSPEDGFRLVLERARLMNLAADRAKEPGIMIAVNAPIDYLEEKLRNESGVGFTNYNSGKQVVLGGATEAVERLAERLASEGHRAIRLKVSMAFHSPILKTVRNEMAEFLNGLDIRPLEIPVMSNATGQAYPNDPAAMREIIVSHLESPVRWMQNVQTLAQDFEVGAFVESGPGNNLCHLITDTLDEPTCINTCQTENEVETFRRAVAQLAALGCVETKIRVAAPATGMGIDPLAAAVQANVNAFILSDKGEAIKPAILESLRQSVEPAMTMEQLEQLLSKGPAPVGTVSVPRAVPIPAVRPAEDECRPLVAPSPATEADDHVEKVIRIIMDATGYERDEIEPDMDIRTDLAIRSSRLPVIMDMAEKAFGVEIALEDFIGVKTVRDIADRLAEKVEAAPTQAPEKTSSPKVTRPGPAVAVADHVEKVIRIIMEATGYERDEIEPDMDIRTDLAIRSSRLPVIMDMAEKAFGVEIALEDFIGVQTVRDIADRLAEKTGAPAASAAVQTPGRPAPQPTTVADDHIEKMIRIIMDATGYERDEIEPDMDIRTDLAIRSSRLPVIMDMAEKAFGVEIALEDFIGVRTVRDIADRLVTSSSGQTASPDDAARAPETAATAAGKSEGEAAPIHRLTFQDVPLPDAAIKPLELAAGSSVAVLGLGRSKDLAARMGAEIQKRFGVEPRILDAESLNELETVESLAGLVLTMDGSAIDAESVGSIQKTAFEAIQKLVQGRTRRFCLLTGRDLGGNERITAEGVLGVLLAGAHEYQSVHFRAVFADNGADPGAMLDHGLNIKHRLTQVIIRNGEVFTPKAANMPTPSRNGAAIGVAKGDVIVVSGGAKGITSHLARALAAFNPLLMLLGRSPADSPEVKETLAELSGLGVEAAYISCDVTDADQTQAALAETAKRYGRIDGIVHGAGVILDGFIQAMTPDEFDQVMAVKLGGARNLYQGGRAHGLRFMVGLSSVSGVFGNVGQANYCAANRAMSAYLRGLNEAGGIVARTFMLPPIAGAGMADTPELRELFELRGMADAFISVTELAELFCRELLLGSRRDAWVLLARSLPPAETVLRDLGFQTSDKRILSAGVFFQPQDLPMIDRVQRLDLAGGEMVAVREFHPDKDLWLEDHRPFKTLRHPLVSGIMAVETFLEAAHAMYPHLTVLGIRDVRYKDILECPPTPAREAKIECNRLTGHNGLIHCRTVLSSRDVSPSGRVLDLWSVNYEGEVILAGRPMPFPEADAFPILGDEITNKGLAAEAVEAMYESGTGLTGRYRVIRSITGSGSDVIQGELVYGQTRDVAGMDSAVYQYSPYILESFWHLLNFHVFLHRKEDVRSAIPTGIGELRFTRTLAPGEPVKIEARRVSENETGHMWDARALDDQGRCVLLARGLQMSWFDA